jgi:hypothetical protein
MAAIALEFSFHRPLLDPVVVVATAAAVPEDDHADWIKYRMVRSHDSAVTATVLVAIGHFACSPAERC